MTPDPWDRLKPLTAARIALGRSGGSLPTRELLDFSLAHARARDAVLSPFNAKALAREIGGLETEVCILSSAAGSRDEFLQRPDRGRALSETSRREIELRSCPPVDLAILVADGLSPLAAHTQAVPVLAELLPRLRGDGWKLAPIAVVRYARVAISDEIGKLLNAELSLILLGERPGLGAPDSLGAYLVFQPGPGRTDADRNCVSNIRPAGLPPVDAAATLHYLLTESRRRKLSGVALKDDRPTLPSGERRISGTADPAQDSRGALSS
jgi:ethanolamine ammonia-lyase small subunit